MIPKRLPNLFIISFFALMFFFVISPDIGYSQPFNPNPGCCVSGSGPNSNCVGCGPDQSTCQFMQTGACRLTPEDNPGECPTPDGDWSNCYVEGDTCFQTDENTGVCQALGCCQIEQGMCFQTSPGQCTEQGFNFLGPGDCLPQFDAECSPLGCCQTPGGDPQMCQTGVTQLACENGGGAWTEGVNCDGNFCGQAPPPTGCCQVAEPASCTENITESQCTEIQGSWTQGNVACDGNFCGEAPFGCCQLEPGECDDITEAQCGGNSFFEGGMCPASGFCEPPPVGCCICGENDCLQTTEFECSNMDCKYIGDNTSCSDFDECNIEPQGCCVLPENPGLSLSNIFDQILDNCVVETEALCNAQDGDYQGDGVSCAEVPQCLPAPARNVPTLGQWGLIAVAGLLGIYSLMMIRRKRAVN